MSDLIGVLVSTSPILSHPSIKIIAETINSIRYHLPTAPIYVMADGVRDEQLHLKEAYRLYKSELTTKMLLDWENVFLFPFPEFTHQAVMTIKTLEVVKHPLLLFIEHDTPLVDRPIDWEFLFATANAGISNHIRLHYDETIHREHQHLMCGNITPNLIKTVQWSQRPHLVNREWYGNLLLEFFRPESRTFIEDRVYGTVEGSPWESFQLTIYDPEGTGQRMKRSRDLNGRGEEQKYSWTF